MVDSSYALIIEYVFDSKYHDNVTSIDFTRADITDAARRCDVKEPKNLGDVIYSFRYRKELPSSIQSRTPEGYEWIIRGAGSGSYRFVLIEKVEVIPNPNLVSTKIPDATPGIVVMYAQEDEQALLAKVRYNRLIDTFVGITCYSLQSHLRSHVRGIGQIETDELYVGVDSKGRQYALPVQAKGERDEFSIVQIEQDAAMCYEKFPGLICLPIAVQFFGGKKIALFSFESVATTTCQPSNGVGLGVPNFFENDSEQLKILDEKHYELVDPDNLSKEELASYQQRL